MRTAEGATGGQPAPPDPSNAQVAALVQEQLQRLGMEYSSDSEDERDGTTIPHSKCRKLKSGRGRTTKDFVVKEVTWPHLGVYKGPERQAAEYDTLTIPEFVDGYVGTIVNSDHTLQEETSARLHHLRELMLDAAAYPWPDIRNYHAIVLTETEHDRLSWSARSTIQDLRAQYAHVIEPHTPIRPRAQTTGPAWADPSRVIITSVVNVNTPGTITRHVGTRWSTHGHGVCGCGAKRMFTLRRIVARKLSQQVTQKTMPQ